MNRGRKFLASILTILLIVQIVPASLVTFALEAKMEQKNTDVVEHITTVPVGYTGIYTKDDLDNVRNKLSGKYIMMNDIEFSESDFAEGGAFYNGGKGWSPIGTDDKNAFTGIFDGNGYVVKKLYVNIISYITRVHAGLFGYNKGAIKNLGMVNSSISASAVSASNNASAYLGGIVGWNANGTISNCYNTGSVMASASVSSSDTYVGTGGIAGYNEKGTITNCYNTGSVSASSSSSAYAGGIAGYNSSGTITNSYNTDSVSSSSSYSSAYAGGITGYYYSGTISGCYNTGSVSSSSLSSYSNAGGIAGDNNGTITNCYNTGSVRASSSYSDAGGIAGNNSGTITNCYNTGSVRASSSYSHAGGITGSRSNSDTRTNCYYLDIVSEGVGDETDTTTKLTLEQMKQQSAFVGFDFEKVWQISGETTYLLPTLKSTLHIEKEENQKDFAGGNGTIYNPFKISNKEQLNNVKNYLENSFILINDVEFTESDFAEGGAFYNDGKGWSPIGTDDKNAFTGIFDGNGYMVKNLYVNRISRLDVYDGLFGYNKGELKNIGIVNGNVTTLALSSSSKAYAGGIVGYNYYGTITNCYTTGNVSAVSADSVGGIVGCNYYGTIANCYNTGNVSAPSADSAGGIVGNDSSGTITNCYNTGSVSTDSVSNSAGAGGIAGYSYSAMIKNCYNTGNVSASSSFSAYAGGVVGESNSHISNCYNIGSVSAYSSSGPSSSREVDAGGVVGRIGEKAAISNCYYLDVVSKGIANGTDTTTKLTIEQMKQQNSFVGFDFENIWQINIETTYKIPTLKSILHIEREENKTDFAGGNGTTYNPFKISSKEQLNNVNNYLQYSFVLINDIEFSNEDFTEGGAFYNDDKGWEPIGTNQQNAFTGIFNGNGYAIKNLYINITSNIGAYVGLFGCNKGAIKNLGVANVSMSTKIIEPSSSSVYVYVGGIAGYNGGTIFDCSNTDSAIASSNKSSYDYVGGISGYNRGAIFDCSNADSVIVSSNKSYDDYVGGISGYNRNTISNCNNTGSVIMSSNESNSVYAGGIVGENEGGKISNCYNTGDVCAYSLSYAYIGGIAGWNSYNNSTISDCYSTTCSVSASSSRYTYVGGIVGYNGASIKNCYNTSSVNVTSLLSLASSCVGGIVGKNYSGIITNGYNVGGVSAMSPSEVYLGGIVGDNDKGTIRNGYYLDSFSKGVGKGTDTTTKLTLDQMMQQSSFGGFDFDSVWEMHPKRLPNLKVFGINDLQSINFANKSVELGLNGQYNTKVSAIPTNASFIIAEYTSQNPLVATVDSNGVITGKSLGTTNIIVRDILTGKTAICTVTVVQGITNISITGSNKVDIGAKTQLTATVLPNDAVNKTLKWSSSDTSIATVDQNGLVTGVNVGTVTITVMATDGTEIKGTYSVKVIKHAEYIVLDKTEIGLKNVETQKLTATIYPVDTSDKKVIWTSSDNSVATVDSNGNVTAKGRGVATITAKTNDGGYEATCTVTVIQPVVSVSLNKMDLLLGTNKTYQLIATINPSNANNQNVRWESGDTTIATVDKNGFVYGVAEGTTTITAITEDGNKVAVCIVTVSSKEPDPIKLGDLTGDGIVDAADAILILRSDAGLITLTEEQKIAADVTKDGVIDSADAIKIARYDAQLITEL